MNLAVKSFFPGAFKEGGTAWSNALKRVAELKEKYGFGSGVKELFLEILSSEKCFSYNRSRIALVQEILVREGYLPIEQGGNYTDEQFAKLVADAK